MVGFAFITFCCFFYHFCLFRLWECYFICFFEWSLDFYLVELLFQVIHFLLQALHEFSRFCTNGRHCSDSHHMLHVPLVWSITSLVSQAYIYTYSYLHSTSRHPSDLLVCTLPMGRSGLPLPRPHTPLHALHNMWAQGLYLGFSNCTDPLLGWIWLRTTQFQQLVSQLGHWDCAIHSLSWAMSLTEMNIAQFKSWRLHTNF